MFWYAFPNPTYALDGASGLYQVIGPLRSLSICVWLTISHLCPGVSQVEITPCFYHPDIFIPILDVATHVAYLTL